MTHGESRERLSQIDTPWTLLRRASDPDQAKRRAAVERLLECYGPAARAYLLGALRDPDAAEELLQEFSVNFLRSGFRNASPGQGRFRFYVRTALSRLVSRHRSRRTSQPDPLPPDAAATLTDPHAADGERAFLDRWRASLLERAWKSLEAEHNSPTPYYAVLRCRADRPDLGGEAMTAQLSAELNAPLTEAGVRTALSRARKLFARLVCQEVADSLHDPSPEEVEEELRELGLIPYCRSALPWKP